MLISDITINYVENAGCNNGNYSMWKGVTAEGEHIGGVVCACMGECSNTDRFVGVHYDNGVLCGTLLVEFEW